MCCISAGMMVVYCRLGCLVVGKMVVVYDVYRMIVMKSKELL